MKNLSATALVMAFLCLAVTASAVFVGGTGSLTAEGVGSINVHGTGTVVLNTQNTTGTLWFKGANPENVKIIYGTGVVYRIGPWTWIHGNGKISVTGNELTLFYKGKGAIMATGNGWADFGGTGTWKTYG